VEQGKGSRGRVAAVFVVVVTVAALAIAWRSRSQPAAERPIAEPPPTVGSEPTGFLLAAIDGTNTWPPPLTAMPANGGEPIKVRVPNPDTSTDWDWSPDGSMLLWLEYVIPPDGDPFDRLVLSEADGSDPKVLVDEVASSGYRGRAWSRDGRSVAYAIMTGKGTDVYVADAATGAATSVAHWDGQEQIDVDWSPDGSQLVVGVPGEGIFTMSRDGSGMRQVSDLSAFRVGWSPTETLVVEAQAPDDTHLGVWTLGVDGSDPRRLSPRGETDLGPVWSPDGQWIAFSRDTEQERQESQPQFGTTVFIMRADGSDVRRVAPAPVDDGWREVWDWLPVAPGTADYSM
jgi:Tol biopolymer transport system component